MKEEREGNEDRGIRREKRPYEYVSRKIPRRRMSAGTNRKGVTKKRNCRRMAGSQAGADYRASLLYGTKTGSRIRKKGTYRFGGEGEIQIRQG